MERAIKIKLVHTVALVNSKWVFSEGILMSLRLDHGCNDDDDVDLSRLVLTTAC